MIDSLAIQDKLQNNDELIIKVLEKLGYSPKNKGEYFSFSNLDGDNQTACVLYKNTLVYKNYTRVGRDGNIFSLVMYDKQSDFPTALKYIAKVIHFRPENETPICLPFHGYFKRICSKTLGHNAVNIPLLDPNDYVDYMNKNNKMFLKDGVDYETQAVFNLGFNRIDNAILIPIYTPAGQLCGIKARNYDPDCPTDKRWWAYERFPKTSIIYGYHINYQEIVQSKTVLIVEAEKSVMQAYSFGFRCCLAVMGHKISKQQVRLIKALNCSRIIIGFDEGVAESDLLLEGLKLLDNKVKVGYIYDRDNKYLKKNTKDSPTDNGRNVLKKILAECIEWIEEDESYEENQNNNVEN